VSRKLCTVAQHRHLRGRRYIVFPPRAYFEGVLARFRKKFNQASFVVATDDPAWCNAQPYFQASDVTVITDCSPWGHHNTKKCPSNAAAIDMATLAACDHAVLSVGTFGWWSAFLGAHTRGGDVLFFHGEFNMDASYWLVHKRNMPTIADYYPPHWIAVDAQGKEAPWGRETQWTNHGNDLYASG
jgi:hypothetical protein